MKHLTDETFDAETKTGIQIVDFHAAWCGPCRMMGPVFEQVAAEAEGRTDSAGRALAFCKVDVDAAPATAAKFGIASIPTILVLKDGVATDSRVGAMPPEALRELVAAALA